MTELRTAACDHHLATALRYLVPEGESRHLNTFHVQGADPQYMCACGVRAHWYVRTVPAVVEPVPGQVEHAGYGR